MSFGSWAMNRCSSRRRRRRVKKEEDEVSIDGLPSEISEDIIWRLPIKSIIQSRCVCRSWELLSQDPHVFHMHISRRCRGSKLFFFHPRVFSYPHDLHMHFIECNNSDENFGIVSKIGTPPFVDDMPEFTVRASCNGLLLCFKGYGYGYGYGYVDDLICIYSPFTSYYKVIPKPDSKYSHHAYGFGCHPVTREYKLVGINYYWEEDLITPEAPPHELEVQVYSLSRNEWRSIGGALADEQLVDPMSPHDGVLLGGRLHWLNRWRRWELNPPSSRSLWWSLIYFDLADDSLGKIPMPEETKNAWCSKLAVLGGCLSFGVYQDDDPIEMMQIWVMKEYGVEQSWVKQYSLVGDSFRKFCSSWRSLLVEIICLLDSGKILIHFAGNWLVSYNCDTNNCNEVTFEGTFSLASTFKPTLDASCF